MDLGLALRRCISIVPIGRPLLRSWRRLAGRSTIVRRTRTSAVGVLLSLLLSLLLGLLGALPGRCLDREGAFAIVAPKPATSISTNASTRLPRQAQTRLTGGKDAGRGSTVRDCRRTEGASPRSCTAAPGAGRRRQDRRVTRRRRAYGAGQTRPAGFCAAAARPGRGGTGASLRVMDAATGSRLLAAVEEMSLDEVSTVHCTGSGRPCHHYLPYYEAPFRPSQQHRTTTITATMLLQRSTTRRACANQ